MAEKVLVVEDNEDSRLLAAKILVHHGFEVIEATTGAQALELARRLLPDVILMDLGLTDMSGNEAARVLRADPTTAGIPLVAFTAYAREQLNHDVKLYDGYIEKPIDVRKFPLLVASFVKRIVQSEPSGQNPHS